MNYELNKIFIKSHLNDDVNKLALSKFPDGVDKQFVIRQIQARHILKKKLPSWSENDEIHFPKRLSLEQCSSELTAKYKASLLCRSQRTTDNRQQTLIDLTGGMGVDTSFLSDNFDETIYVESQEELCELAEHNFKVLGKNIKVVNAKAEDFLLQCDKVDCIYIDPARRDEHGRKMVSLHDCSPDVAELQDLLFEKSDTILIKLSPMLDIDIIKKELKNVKEIHVVAVKNECKEVLVLCQRTTDKLSAVSRQPSATKHRLNEYKVVDLHENWNLSFIEEEERNAVVTYADEVGKYLYEPSVACMKAACFRLLSEKYNVKKLDRNSHLYTSNELVSDFPGRIFEVINVVPFNKKAKKEILESQGHKDARTQGYNDSESQGHKVTRTQGHNNSVTLKASIAVRNFPMTAEELRKHLGFKDGDDFYIFGTTMKGDKKVLILGKKN